MRAVPSQRLTVSLIQRGYLEPDEVLTAEALNAVDRLPLRRSLPYRGVLYIERQRRREPRWVRFVNTGLRDPLTGIRTATSSAALVLTAAGHLFVYSFGHGRHFLREDRVERDFGLRVVLNVVDPESLRSVDIRTLDETTLLTTRQASRDSTLGAFGIDVSRDMLRAVTGRPRDQGLARTVTGADRLAFTAELSIDQLADKCVALLDAYSSTTYKEQFGWIDNLRVVRDRTLSTTLDNELGTRLAANDLQRFHFAAPEQVNWDIAEGYRYSIDPRDAPLRDELDISEYVDAATIKRGHPPDLRHLRGDAILVMGAGEQPLQRWSIYRSLVFDMAFAGATYTLTDGHWYEIDANFADDVRTQVAGLADCDLWFPDANRGEREDAYLARAAPQMSAAAGFHVALMDRRLARAAGARTGVEVCDLLSALAHFIHVKKGNQSATLSHLFSQGTVSAELFVADPLFRAEARAHLTDTPCDSDDLFPAAVPRGHVTVVYGIVNAALGALEDTLPFFSQVNLVNAARRLRALGCNLEKKHIGLA